MPQPLYRATWLQKPWSFLLMSSKAIHLTAASIPDDDDDNNNNATINCKEKVGLAKRDKNKTQERQATQTKKLVTTNRPIPASPWPVAPTNLPPLILLLSMMPYGLEYLWSFGVRTLSSCVLPTPCIPPAYSLVGQCEELKRPWRCVSTAQQ